MSISTHVIAFRPPDERWQKMKKLYDACIDAGVEIPKDVWEFFGREKPDDRGVEVKIEGNTTIVRNYTTQDTEGFEIDILALPKDIRFIRFYNSW